jgi:hypothetical protein
VFAGEFHVPPEQLVGAITSMAGPLSHPELQDEILSIMGFFIMG